ncbi:collagen alpha-1(I) chain-like [Aquila chrysaetos chrysaetos]|uniref:collagen alpha-1(I) chain-like n=1 Tax=Aquila chrysaetos chrysaetos TaxID=223781 RepID=UPI001B7D4550|nr:collagen alpha-1(I) chain-like [Aquila chrysaetos chrysaetos]
MALTEVPRSTRGYGDKRLPFHRRYVQRTPLKTVSSSKRSPGTNSASPPPRRAPLPLRPGSPGKPHGAAGPGRASSAQPPPGQGGSRRRCPAPAPPAARGARRGAGLGRAHLPRAGAGRGAGQAGAAGPPRGRCPSEGRPSRGELAAPLAVCPFPSRAEPLPGGRRERSRARRADRSHKITTPAGASGSRQSRRRPGRASRQAGAEAGRHLCPTPAALRPPVRALARLASPGHGPAPPPPRRAGGAESVRARLFVRGDSPRPLGGASTPRAGNRPARPAALPAVTLPPPLTPPARGAWQGERRRRHVTARPGARSPGGRRAGGRRAGGRAAGGRAAPPRTQTRSHRGGASAAGHAGLALRCRRSATPPPPPQPPPPSATPGIAGADGGPAPSAPPAERKCEGAGGGGGGQRRTGLGCAGCWMEVPEEESFQALRATRSPGRHAVGRRRHPGAREPQPGRGAAGTSVSVGSQLRGGGGGQDSSRRGRGGSQQGSLRGACETSCVAAGAVRWREQGVGGCRCLPRPPGRAAHLCGRRRRPGPGPGPPPPRRPPPPAALPGGGALGPPARLPLAGGPAGPRPLGPPSRRAGPQPPAARRGATGSSSVRDWRKRRRIPRGMSRRTKLR